MSGRLAGFCETWATRTRQPPRSCLSASSPFGFELPECAGAGADPGVASAAVGAGADASTPIRPWRPAPRWLRRGSAGRWLGRRVRRRVGDRARPERLGSGSRSARGRRPWVGGAARRSERPWPRSRPAGSAACSGRGAARAGSGIRRPSSGWRQGQRCVWPSRPARWARLPGRRRPRRACPTTISRSRATSWSAKAGRSRPLASSRSRTLMPSKRSATSHGRQEGVDLLLVGHAQQVAHAIGGDGLDAGAEELVEHRLGIAHAAGGQVRDERDGLVIGASGRPPRGSVAACPRSARPSAAGT